MVFFLFPFLLDSPEPCPSARMDGYYEESNDCKSLLYMGSFNPYNCPSLQKDVSYIDEELI